MKIRFPGGQRNLALFLLVAVGAFLITLYVTPSKPSVGPATLPPSEVATGPPLVEGSLPESGEPAPAPADRTHAAPPEASDSPNLRAYAIPLIEVQGLPPDVAAGTRLELWVAWEPPITEKRRIQKLFGGARVGRVIEPTVAEAPTTVELLVPAEELPELLFADRHGALNAAVLPP